MVDHISDSFIVINEEYEIIDYNKPLIKTFEGVFKVKRKDNLVKVLDLNNIRGIDPVDLVELVNRAKSTRKSVSVERNIVLGSFDKYFTIEVTPIFNQDNYIGTIILLKDITQHVKNLELIKETQNQLIERERLASLGQLIGGIAHNLKTPIMSISGGIEALKDLVREYDESIGDKSVTEDDHHEIAEEMLTWLNKMRPYCSYMSDIISTVKGQAVQFNTASAISFTLEELVRRVDLLMKHELKKYHCILKTSFEVDMNTELKGDISSLVQIFDNLIINAIHAYEGESGNIDLTIKKVDNNIVFMLSDYGKGICPEIRDKLFKEMVTTKGKNGTGLGLYMSYSTIKGRFGGNMRFESGIGQGTTFYISIPSLSC